MRLVIVETPLRADTEALRGRNRRYLKAAMLDCIRRGEAPFASHMMYVQVLDDDVPAERIVGIKCGLAWGELADATVVYEDLGVSGGMQQGIDDAVRHIRPVEWRRLPGWPEN